MDDVVEMVQTLRLVQSNRSGHTQSYRVQGRQTA